MRIEYLLLLGKSIEFSYICSMDMKKRVLKNIIDYVSIEEINTSNPNSNIFESGISLNILSPFLIWSQLSIDLKFDKISNYLLKNFNDAIENEDYESALKMKSEIRNHWDISINEFWILGRDYLVNLKNGCMNSKIFDQYTDLSDDLLKDWISDENYTENITKYNLFIDRLSELSDYINNYYPYEDSKNEIINVLTGEDQNYNHPALSIDMVLQYFKLLRK